MFCKECGKKIEEGSKFCTGCGRKIEPIAMHNISNNKELYVKREEKSNNQNVNYYNSNTNTQNINYVAKEDKPSILLNIVAFFVPIAGLILFLSMREETPRKAKSVGITALVGYVVSILLSILLFVVQMVFVINSVEDEYYKYDYYDRPYYYNERDYNI